MGDIVIPYEVAQALRQHSPIIDTYAEDLSNGSSVVLPRASFHIFTESQWEGVRRLFQRFPEMEAEEQGRFARMATSLLRISRFAEHQQVSLQSVIDMYICISGCLAENDYDGSIDDLLEIGDDIANVREFTTDLSIDVEDMKIIGDFFGLEGGRRRNRKARKTRKVSRRH